MKFHHKFAGMFGYDLIKIKKNHLTLESHLVNLFKTLDINCVLDVGGNVGQYAMMLRKTGYEGRIISFEPVSETFKILSEHAKDDPAWDVYNFALGEKDEEKVINVTASSDFSSFLDPSDYAKDAYAGSSKILEKETVKIKTLDDCVNEIIPDITASNIHLKLDTQGYDLQVVKGASDTLPFIKSLQSEVSVTPVYDETPDYIESIVAYRALGFEVTGMYPVSRDRMSQILIEFDCVMRSS